MACILPTVLILDRYGKRTSAEFLLHERPILSFPISLVIPKEARYLSELIDYDTIPLIGFLLFIG